MEERYVVRRPACMNCPWISGGDQVGSTKTGYAQRIEKVETGGCGSSGKRIFIGNAGVGSPFFGIPLLPRRPNGLPPPPPPPIAFVGRWVWRRLPDRRRPGNHSSIHPLPGMAYHLSSLNTPPAKSCNLPLHFHPPMRKKQFFL